MTSEPGTSERKAEGGMRLVEHLVELRKRLLYCIASTLAGFLAAWHFRKEIYDLLMKPLVDVMGEDKTMIFTAPAEAFVTYLKVAIVSGIFAASPVILWQIWKFVAPGLYKKERRYFQAVVFFGSIFFIGGALFGYFGVFPIGFDYFINTFQTENIQALITLKEYFKFSLNLLLGFGIAFELPVFIFFLARVGLVTPRWLLKNIRFAVLIIFVGSAIFTPPDVISQVILGVPLIALYLLATGVAYLFGAKREKAEEEEPESADTDGETDPSPDQSDEKTE